MNKYTGHCECGHVTVCLETEAGVARLVPRACDCAFCTAYGAVWVSDPKSSLQVRVHNHALKQLKQGSETATFWQCRSCDNIVCVTVDIGGQKKGAVNLKLLDDIGFFPKSISVSPKQFSKEEKLARWQQNWISRVDMLPESS